MRFAVTYIGLFLGANQDAVYAELDCTVYLELLLRFFDTTPVGRILESFLQGFRN